MGGGYNEHMIVHLGFHASTLETEIWFWLLRQEFQGSMLPMPLQIDSNCHNTMKV